MASTNPGNFANRPHEEVVEIAAKGGHHSHGVPEPTTTNTNPGNFANRPHEEVVEAASKGGHASHSGAPAHEEGRTATGQFVEGSEAAREAGRKGGAAHGSA